MRKYLSLDHNYNEKHECRVFSYRSPKSFYTSPLVVKSHDLQLCRNKLK